MEFSLVAISMALWGMFFLELVNTVFIIVGVLNSNDDDNELK